MPNRDLVFSGISIAVRDTDGALNIKASCARKTVE